MMGTETASISSFENIEGMDPAQLQLGLGPCWPSRAQNGFNLPRFRMWCPQDSLYMSITTTTLGFMADFSLYGLFMAV